MKIGFRRMALDSRAEFELANGLFLACELALAKCSVLILEKTEDPHSPLKQLSFGIRGLSAPIIEALYRRGLLQELEIHKRLKNPHQNSGEGSRRQVGHFAGIPFHDGDIDTSQWTYRLPRRCNNRWADARWSRRKRSASSTKVPMSY